MDEGTPSHRNGTVPVFAAKGDLSASSRPTVSDLQGDNHYAEIARKYWLKNKKAPKVQPKVVKEELWESLEKEGFAYTSLLILETLQVLEKYVQFWNEMQKMLTIIGICGLDTRSRPQTITYSYLPSLSMSSAAKTSLHGRTSQRSRPSFLPSFAAYCP
jgi:hypothetical protein